MIESGDRRDTTTGARVRAAVLYGGTAALALSAPKVSRILGRRLPTGAAEATTTAALVVLGWGVIGWMERRSPFRVDWNRARGDVGTDVADLLVSDGWGTAVAGLAVSPIRKRLADREGGGPLGPLPLPARVAALILAFDLSHYTLHRVMHEHVGWRFHAVHHSPDRLYVLNATRFHPVELALDGLQEQLMLSVLGVDRETRLSYQVFRGIYGQIQHANVDMRSGPLNRVLSTPERHRWHHSTDSAQGNTNYGAIVAVWDEVFGSSYTPDRAFNARLGNGDKDYPTAWIGQLVAPFR